MDLFLFAQPFEHRVASSYHNPVGGKCILKPCLFSQELIIVLMVGVFSFSGGIAAAVSSKDWQNQIDAWEDQAGVVIFSRGHRIPRDLAATAVSWAI